MPINWYISDKNGVIVETLLNNEELNYTFEEQGLYTVRVESCNCCGCCNYDKEIWVGDAVQFVRKSCGTFTVHDLKDYGRTVNKRVAIINMKDEVLCNERFDLQPAEGGKIDIHVQQDGIYLIEYVVMDTNGIEMTSRRWVMYEFCSIVECYRKMLMDLLCDDCKPMCGRKEEVEPLMNQINAFIATASAFFYGTSIHYGISDGYFYLDHDHIGLLRRTQHFLDQLMKICRKCGCLEMRNLHPKTCINLSNLNQY